MANISWPLATAVDRLVEEIKGAFPLVTSMSAPAYDAESQMQMLEWIAHSLEPAQQVIEAKLQQLRPRLVGVPRSEKYPWWLPSVESLEVMQVAPAVIDSLAELSRALSAYPPPAFDAEDARSDGSIELTWNVPRALLWRISAPGASWPIVRVRAYWTDVVSGKPMARTWRYAGSAVAHACAVLTAGAGGSGDGIAGSD